jgi:MSHA pilin protein MshD
VELVMGIAVLGIVLAGATTLFFNLARRSADPMIQQQAQLIAESYLDEILIKRFYDLDTATVCTGTAEASRDLYDNVCDYNGLNEAPRDQFGTAITGLAAYNVQVTVTSSGVTLNGVDNTGNVRVLRVDVTVTGPASTSVTLSAYRTNYECDAGGAECKPL